MTRSSLDPIDLSALCRRGEAEASEQRRLKMLHDASPFESELFAIGAAYDAEPSSHPGDAALLARAVGGALGRKHQAARTRAWMSPAVSVALICGAVASGAAALTFPHWRSGTAPSTSPVAAASNASTQVPLRDEPTSGERPSLPARGVPEPAPQLGTAAPVTARLGSTSKRTAADLFAQANALRRQQRTERAIASYQELQQAHPRSPEATLSYVMLARLFAQRGSHRSADQYFARYLTTGDSSLAEEAWLGRAAAARGLHQMKLEREALRTLSERFPKSIYLESARQRLKELD